MSSSSLPRQSCQKSCHLLGTLSTESIALTIIFKLKTKGSGCSWPRRYRSRITSGCSHIGLKTRWSSYPNVSCRRRFHHLLRNLHAIFHLSFEVPALQNPSTGGSARLRRLSANGDGWCLRIPVSAWLRHRQLKFWQTETWSLIRQLDQKFLRA